MPLRGGSYNNNDNAGLAALNLNNERNNSNNNVGFRPALACSRIWTAYGQPSAPGKRSVTPVPPGTNRKHITGSGQ